MWELKKQIKEMEEKLQQYREEYLVYKNAGETLKMVAVEKHGKDLKLEIELKKRMLLAKEIGMGKHRDEYKKPKEQLVIKPIEKKITFPPAKFNHE